MKKTVSVLLALIFAVLSLTAFAAEPEQEAYIRFNSDIASLSYLDYQKIVEIYSDDICILYEDDPVPVLICDVAGNPYFDALKPGRSYELHLTVRAAEGASLPEDLGSETMEFGKGCTLLWCGETLGVDREGNAEMFFSASVKITVDASLLRIFFGRIADLFVKLRSFSLY